MTQQQVVHPAGGTYPSTPVLPPKPAPVPVKPDGAPLDWADPVDSVEVPVAVEMVPYVDPPLIMTLYGKLREGFSPVQLQNAFSSPCSAGVFHNSLKVALWKLHRQRVENRPEGQQFTKTTKGALSSHLELYLRGPNRSHGVGDDFGKIEFEGMDLDKGIQSDRLYVDRPDGDALAKHAEACDSVSEHMQKLEQQALAELSEPDDDPLVPIEAAAQKHQEGVENAEAVARKHFFGHFGGGTNEPAFDPPLPGGQGAPVIERGYIGPLEEPRPSAGPRVIEAPPPLQVRSQYEFEIHEHPTHLEVTCGEDRATFPLEFAPAILTFVEGLKKIGAVKLFREV